MNIKKKGLLTITISFIAVAIVIGFLGWQKLYSMSLEQQKDNGFYILRSIEASIDKEKFKDIMENRDMEDPYYKELVERLTKIREVNNLEYLYTESFDVDGKSTIYGLDSYVEGDLEAMAYIGEPVDPDDEDEAMLEALQEGKETYSSELSHSRWGDLISCYLPIIDNDEVLGVIALDISMDTIVKQTKSLILNLEIIIIIVSIIAAVVIYLLLQNGIVKNIIEIQNNIKNIKNGDFADAVSEKILNRKDELGSIGKSLEEMRRELSNVIVKVRGQSVSISSLVNTTFEQVNGLNNEVNSILSQSQEVTAGVEENLAATQEISTTSVELENIAKSVSLETKKGVNVTKEITNKAELLKVNADTQKEKNR